MLIGWENIFAYLMVKMLEKFINIYKIVAFKFFLTATYSKKYILHYNTPLTHIKLFCFSLMIFVAHWIGFTFACEAWPTVKKALLYRAKMYKLPFFSTHMLCTVLSIYLQKSRIQLPNWRQWKEIQCSYVSLWRKYKSKSSVSPQGAFYSSCGKKIYSQKLTVGPQVWQWKT